MDNPRHRIRPVNSDYRTVAAGLDRLAAPKAPAAAPQAVTEAFAAPETPRTLAEMVRTRQTAAQAAPVVINQAVDECDRPIGSVILPPVMRRQPHARTRPVPAAVVEAAPPPTPVPVRRATPPKLSAAAMAVRAMNGTR